MPFPANLEALEKSGYTFQKMEVCGECGQSIETFLTPGKRTVSCNPMPLLTDPATEHWRTCDPSKPQNRDALGKNNWKFGGRVQCGKCKRAVETWTSPEGEGFVYQVMMEGLWAVELHSDFCGKVQSRTQVAKPSQEAEHSGVSTEGQQERGEAPGGQEIKLYGVNDPNGQIIAAGYDSPSSVLRLRFKTATWDYQDVPEDKFVSIRKVPFAYAFFTKSIKGKFP